MEHVKCEEIAAFLRGKSLESVAKIFTGKDLNFLTFQYKIYNINFIWSTCVFFSKIVSFNFLTKL